MVILIDEGHIINKGASGILSETSVNRAVGKELINVLRSAGHTVIDCTDNNLELAGRVQKANAQKADLFVSLHCNAFNGNAYGTETFVYNGNYSGKENNKAIAKRVNDSVVSAFGFTNRGVKEDNFYVLRETIAPAILIEMFFCDNSGDCNKYGGNAVKMARAIANGIDSKIPVNVPSKPSTPVPSGDTYFRVVCGSYKDRKNAEAQMAKLKKAGFDCFLDAYKK